MSSIAFTMPGCHGTRWAAHGSCHDDVDDWQPETITFGWLTVLSIAQSWPCVTGAPCGSKPEQYCSMIASPVVATGYI